MNTLDLLYITLSIGTLVVVGLMSWLVYHAVQTLKVAQYVMHDIEGLTADISTLRTFTKKGFFGLISTVLDPISRKEVKAYE